MYKQDACRIVNERAQEVFNRARGILDSMGEAGMHKVMSFHDAVPVAVSSAITEVTGLKGAEVTIPFDSGEMMAVQITFPGLPDKEAN